jgi:hypothetical protein
LLQLGQTHTCQDQKKDGKIARATLTVALLVQ